MRRLRQTLKLTFLLLLCAELTSAQKFQWANRAGGSGFDEGNSLGVDAAGNSYVIGTFSDTATFGSFTVIPTHLIDNFSPDAVFLAKYDGLGREVWAKKISDSNLDFGKDIAVDSLGNIYVTGGFSGTVIFGNITLVSSGFGDMFFAKYDSDGNFVWAQKAGGSSFTIAHSIALDAAGNSYVTGYFRASVVFGSFTLTSTGRDDVFLVKYDKDGNVLWAKRAGGSAITGSTVGADVAVTPVGDCYVTGFFYGSATFDAFTLPGNTKQELRVDVFLVKYDADGKVLWARQIDNPLEDTPGGLAVDQAGNCYITGSFIGTAIFNTSSLTSKGAEDAFIVKYDPVGTVIWAKNVGGPARDMGKDIAIQADGSIYTTGTFTGNAVFENTALTSKGDLDVYITKWDAAGREIFSVSAGGASPDVVNKITLDATGNAYVTGSFKEDSSFGVIFVTSKGDLDVFVAKFGQPFSAPETTISTNSIANFNYCAGPVLYVPFRTSGFFNTDNTFTVQLSDANGSFAAPVTIGTGSKSPLMATIPANTPAGSGYQIRVVATSPAVISEANATVLNITPVGLGAPIPNIITPNGDGLNDTFALKVSCLVMGLKVYNRWGKLVYEQANYKNTWNGTHLTEGIYYYQLRSNTGLSWKGWVEISR